jgi:hypothetical protein
MKGPYPPETACELKDKETVPWPGQHVKHATAQGAPRARETGLRDGPARLHDALPFAGAKLGDEAREAPMSMEERRALGRKAVHARGERAGSKANEGRRSCRALRAFA